MNRLRAVAERGQSLWYDYIQRGMIWSGALQRMVREDDLRGITSNPAIFEKAIGKSADYVGTVKALARRGLSAGEIYEQIAIQDIQLAADVLSEVYDRTGGRDGYVSLEVSPHLAHRTAATVTEALRLWEAVGRDNVMIKVPATPAGIPAIETLIAHGLNINVTLLFSNDAYEAVFQAYQRGLEARAAKGLPVDRIASVASFFVSRIDVAIDGQIDTRLKKGGERDVEGLRALRGKVAIANAKLAYAAYQRLTTTTSWKALEQHGAATQRLLWASTGTKDPSYRDVVYVETLIGPDTVNTVPEATWEAFRKHGEAATTLTEGVAEAAQVMKRAAELGISMQAVTDQLLTEGVEKFEDAFDSLLGTVETRRREVLGSRLARMSLSSAVSDLEKVRKSGLVHRLWQKDATLFGLERPNDPAAAGFMGWLDQLPRTREDLPDLLRFQAACKQVKHVVLMGMGGSSLAPDVFARVLGAQPGFPELHVLDSTVPAQVQSVADRIDFASTLFVVSSKSGSTAEPNAFLAYFYNRVKDGSRFAVVTDPGSALERRARSLGFGYFFRGEPTVGGRFSALSNFGMVAAAALGLDVRDLLDRAALMAGSCSSDVPPAQNPGVQLGLFLGEHAKAGRDKLTFLSSPKLAPLGAWLEQLVAESTGKNGVGIVPVDLEPGRASERSADRVFACFSLEGEAQTVAADLVAAGRPVVQVVLKDPADLVQEMFRWEIATAVAGHVLGINPFDQPNVQESKDFTNTYLAAFARDKHLPAPEGEQKLLESNGVSFYTDEANAALLAADRPAAVLEKLLGRVETGDYVALNAYLEMNETHVAALSALRARLGARTKVATTLGFGPRFLHSTGQIHKGGANNGVFLVLTQDDAKDLPVPGEHYSFSVLKTAQANGDFAALSARGRRVLRVHLSDPEQGLARLSEWLA